MDLAELFQRLREFRGLGFALPDDTQIKVVVDLGPEDCDPDGIYAELEIDRVAVSNSRNGARQVLTIHLRNEA